MPGALEFDHIVAAARTRSGGACLVADESLSLNNSWTTDESRTLLAAGVDAAMPLRYAALRDIRYDGQRWRARL